MAACLILHFATKAEMNAFLAIPQTLERIEQLMTASTTTFQQAQSDMHAAVQAAVAQATNVEALVQDLNQQIAAKNAQIATLTANQADPTLIAQEEADAQTLQGIVTAFAALIPSTPAPASAPAAPAPSSAPSG